MPCNHKICGNIQKLWLPYEFREQAKGLRAHPYCLTCGAVKNISSDRARPLGYYMNILTNLSLTKVQTRLISKDLEKIGDFDDTFSISKFAQEQVFINIVKKYSSLSEHTIIAVLQYHL